MITRTKQKRRIGAQVGQQRQQLSVRPACAVEKNAGWSAPQVTTRPQPLEGAPIRAGIVRCQRGPRLSSSVLLLLLPLSLLCLVCVSRLAHSSNAFCSLSLLIDAKFRVPSAHTNLESQISNPKISEHFFAWLRVDSSPRHTHTHSMGSVALGPMPPLRDGAATATSHSLSCLVSHCCARFYRVESSYESSQVSRSPAPFHLNQTLRTRRREQIAHLREHSCFEQR